MKKLKNDVDCCLSALSYFIEEKFVFNKLKIEQNRVFDKLDSDNIKIETDTSEKSETTIDDILNSYSQSVGKDNSVRLYTGCAKYYYSLGEQKKKNNNKKLENSESIINFDLDSISILRELSMLKQVEKRKGREIMENLILENPRRGDIWNIYIDLEKKNMKYSLEKLEKCEKDLKLLKLEMKKIKQKKTFYVEEKTNEKLINIYLEYLKRKELELKEDKINYDENVENVRSLFDKVISLSSSLSSKIMKGFLVGFLEFEKNVGGIDLGISGDSNISKKKTKTESRIKHVEDLSKLYSKQVLEKQKREYEKDGISFKIDDDENGLDDEDDI
jgi:hypothetical protein